MTAPLITQDKEVIELDPNFSTTRLVMREKPVIVNDPSSKVQSLLFLPPNSERRREGGLRTQGYFKHSYREDNGLSTHSPLPLVTIITVVFNGGKYLDQAIQSVMNQTYNNVEYIVIDGGSTDGTVDIILKYENKIDYWVSETDNGIYDAMNKGWQLSLGNYIYYLGSDDILLNLPCQAIKKAQLNNIDIIYGNVIMSNGKLFKCQYNASIIFRNLLSHQGIFISRRLTNIPFNTKYKVYADFDFNQKMYKRGATSIQDSSIISYFRIGGASSFSDDLKTENLKQEFADIIYNNFGLLGVILSWIWGVLRSLVFKNNIDACANYKVIKKILITYFTKTKVS